MAIFGKPKYSTVNVKKRDIPKGLWTTCPRSGELVYNKDLEKNLMVVPASGYHFPLSAPKRIASLLDKGSFKEEDKKVSSLDPLKFKGVAAYADKIKENKQKTGLAEAVISGLGKMNGREVSIAVMDFRFLGASMGSAVGEKITRAIERAIERKSPMIIVSASGGARMYEGILSLMQMAKTSAALARLSKARLPYVSVLTNPTMAGVMASFASLGDIIMAEPKALIGFAGPRVIKETTQRELPEGFQTAEFLLEHGLIDQIVQRHELRDRLISFFDLLVPSPKPKAKAKPRSKARATKK
jgi:acetyl-CoA carboxylase carboxyl transferase subunit beta